jgi:hypothetical protein
MMIEKLESGEEVLKLELDRQGFGDSVASE